MPRLGEDPNVATAYPNRHQMGRGGLLRQLLTTALGSLLIYFIFNKVYLTDYRVRVEEKGIVGVFKTIIRTGDRLKVSLIRGDDSINCSHSFIRAHFPYSQREVVMSQSRVDPESSAETLRNIGLGEGARV